MAEDTWATALERHRPYLRILAGLEAGGRLRGRVEPSDLVQQAMLRAHRALGTFRGTTEAEFAAWLRRILARVLANALRDLGRARRDAGRERALGASLDGSACRLAELAAAAGPSPSQAADRNEQAVRLAAALEALPDSQREALALHYLTVRSREMSPRRAHPDERSDPACRPRPAPDSNPDPPPAAVRARSDPGRPRDA